MERFEMASGHVTISAETITLDIDRLHLAKQLYHRSKLVSAFFGLCPLYIGVMLVVRPDLFPWELTIFVIVLIGGFLSWKVLKRRRSAVMTTDRTIPRETVSMVVYNEGGKISEPDIAIVYQEGGETKLRQIVFPPGILGGDKDLQTAKEAFRDANIELKSVTELADGDETVDR